MKKTFILFRAIHYLTCHDESLLKSICVYHILRRKCRILLEPIVSVQSELKWVRASCGLASLFRFPSPGETGWRCPQFQRGACLQSGRRWHQWKWCPGWCFWKVVSDYLWNVSQFGFPWDFLMIKFGLCILGAKISQIWSCSLHSTSYQEAHDITWEFFSFLT